ncbi:MAG TPA: hypothetical protein VM822_09325, partial [Pseudolabrys sp.]|nr:hypothetical protein [Pseudolabrys sp.]
PHAVRLREEAKLQMRSSRRNLRLVSVDPSAPKGAGMHMPSDHITRVKLPELVRARIEWNVAIQAPADRRCQKHRGGSY